MLKVSEDETRYFKQLNERQHRLYVGLKAKILGYRGVKIVSDACGVDIKTVKRAN